MSSRVKLLLILWSMYSLKTQVFILNYFKRFPDFRYNKSKETIEEFNRLVEQMEWSSYKRRRELRALQTAIARQFNTTFGEDATNLQNWEKLCRAINADPVPTTVEGCKKVKPCV